MLPVLPLRLHFTATTDGDLGDFPGALWRSVMGLHLKRRHCLGGDDASGACALGDRCVYHAVMAPVPPADASLIGGKRNAPPPYILSPCNSGLIGAGEQVALDLTLVGHGSRHTTAIIRALQAGAEQGLGSERLRLCLRLDTVHLRTGHDTCIDTPIDPTHPPPAESPSHAPPVPRQICLRLEKPLRLRENGRYLRPQHFTIRAFIKSLLLRVHNLADTLAPDIQRPDARQLLAFCDTLDMTADLDWQRQQRWSARQKASVDTSGIVGHLTLTSATAALPAALWQLLWAGQWLHVGKGTTMGMGRYRVEVLGQSRIWLVTRHPGAAEFLHQSGWKFDRQVAHLDPDQIHPGDTVIGTLPLNLAAIVCARGARLLHLSLDLPAEWRGKELDAEQMSACNARLEAFDVRKLDAAAAAAATSSA